MMRKLNKIIKQHTKNKMSRKKKNVEVMEYLDFIIESFEKTEPIKVHQFKKLRVAVFLERYFEKEMIDSKTNVVEDLFNYFDMDLYGVDKSKVNSMHSYLTNPDETTRNRIKLLCVRDKVICGILNEYGF